MSAMCDVDELVATVIEVSGGRVTSTTWTARWGCNRGFWLRVEWLWQEPLPKTLDVLRELGLI